MKFDFHSIVALIHPARGGREKWEEVRRMNLFDIDARLHVQNIDEVTEKLERISALLKEIREELLQLGFTPRQDD